MQHRINNHLLLFVSPVPLVVKTTNLKAQTRMDSGRGKMNPDFLCHTKKYPGPADRLGWNQSVYNCHIRFLRIVLQYNFSQHGARPELILRCVPDFSVSILPVFHRITASSLSPVTQIKIFYNPVITQFKFLFWFVPGKTILRRRWFNEFVQWPRAFWNWQGNGPKAQPKQIAASCACVRIAYTEE